MLVLPHPQNFKPATSQPQVGQKVKFCDNHTFSRAIPPTLEPRAGPGKRPLGLSWAPPGPGLSWAPPGLLGLSWASPGPLLGLSWASPGPPGPFLGLSWASPEPLLALSWASPSFS